MSYYILANVSLLTGWVMLKIMPWGRTSFRARKVTARMLLAGALLAPAVAAWLPEFPGSATDPIVDVDGAERVIAPVRRVLEQPVRILPNIAHVSEPAAVPWWPLLLVLGGAWMFGLSLRGWWRLRRLLARNFYLHQIGRVRVAIHESVDVPFSLWTPRAAFVVLPAALLSRREDFRIAVRHEMEHHRRRDTFCTQALELLTSLFYLNPAIYAWKRSLLQLQELACDEALISRMRIPARAYGSCLLRVAETALAPRIMHAGTTCMIPPSHQPGHSFLRRRIEMFAQHETASSKKKTTVIFGTLAVVGVMLAAYTAQAAWQGGTHVNPGHAVFDLNIQEIATRTLQKGVADYAAAGGIAVVSDPERGTVLAAVGVNQGMTEDLKGDWALAYQVEPASSFKTLVVASALEKGLTTPDEIYDTGNGEYLLGHMLNHDYEPMGKLTVASIVARSSNIGTIKIAQKLGASGLRQVFRDFGIGNGEAVGDFPAARAGRIPDSVPPINDDNYVAIVAQGAWHWRQTFTVTPLEIVQAYGAIANGGHLMRAIPDDGKSQPVKIRDVMSSSVAAQMRDILRYAVTDGTGKTISDSPNALAGKTFSMSHAGKDHQSGFVGMVPAVNPRYVVYIALFDIKARENSGAHTAAYVFRNIAEQIVK